MTKPDINTYNLNHAKSKFIDACRKKQNNDSLKFKTTIWLHQMSVDQSVNPTRPGLEKFNTAEVHDKDSKLAVMKMLRDLKDIMNSLLGKSVKP